MTYIYLAFQHSFHQIIVDTILVLGDEILNAIFVADCNMKITLY